MASNTVWSHTAGKDLWHTAGSGPWKQKWAPLSLITELWESLLTIGDLTFILALINTATGHRQSDTQTLIDKSSLTSLVWAWLAQAAQRWLAHCRPSLTSSCETQSQCPRGWRCSMYCPPDLHPSTFSYTLNNHCTHLYQQLINCTTHTH